MTGDVDLVTFLRARLDEDEAWAVAASTASELHGGEVVATGVHWRWGTGENWETVIPDPALDEFVGDGDATLVTVEERPALSGRWWTLPIYNVRCEEVLSTVAGHIARHDPARVLRDVQAKRRIVDEHPLVPATSSPGSVEVGCKVCDHWVSCYGEDEYEPSGGCPTLRLLALPDSDHPDYDPSWSPS